MQIDKLEQKEWWGRRRRRRRRRRGPNYRNLYNGCRRRSSHYWRLYRKYLHYYRKYLGYYRYANSRAKRFSASVRHLQSQLRSSNINYSNSIQKLKKYYKSHFQKYFFKNYFNKSVQDCKVGNCKKVLVSKGAAKPAYNINCNYSCKWSG